MPGKKRQRKDSEARTFSMKFRTRWRHVLLIEDRIRCGLAPNCAELASELEVSRRTVLRDVDFLRYDLGAPVRYDASRGGYVFTEPNWNMPNVRITEGELLAVMVAEKALEAYAGTPWAERLAHAFERIKASLPERVEVAPEELLSRVDFDAGPSAAVDPRVLSTLAAAVTGNQTVRMEYRALGRELARTYTIDPYILRHMRGAWYLAGRDHASGHVPLFNLTRIVRVEPTGGTFDYARAGFDPATYFANTFGAFESPGRHRVVIEFSGLAAELVAERVWQRSQKLKGLPGGRLRFEATVSHLADVRPWVLSWGAEAKVVEPPELRRAVADEAAKMAARYSVSPSHRKANVGGTKHE